MGKTLTWFFEDQGSRVPSYYITSTLIPSAVYINADVAPDADDLSVEITDGTSIFAVGSDEYPTASDTDGELEYYTLSGTFSANETITGGTSGATATVVTDNAIGSMTVARASTTVFSAETITGGTSTATAVVAAYVAPINTEVIELVANTAYPILAKGETSTDLPADFRDAPIEEGSWITCSITVGGKGITVQLELDEESDI